MQLHSSQSMQELKEKWQTTKEGLILSTIVLAPDLIDLPRLLRNFKQKYSYQERLKKLNWIREVAEESSKRKEETEAIQKSFEMIWQGFSKICLQEKEENLLKNEGEKQAFMWLLCTIFCDGFHLPNQKNIFYTGIGYGEFWAVTYRMYQVGQISLKEAVYLARSRGNRMSLTMEPYYMVHIRENKRQSVYAFLPRNSKAGVLATKKTHYYLYGKAEDLKKIAVCYSVEMQESVPYFSNYLLDFAHAFARRFPCGENAIDDQIILTRGYKNIEELIKWQFCSRVDEEAIRKEISYYEPNLVRNI